MKELKTAYRDITPSRALIDSTKRSVRLASDAREKRSFAPLQLLKLAPALCVLVLAATLVLPRSNADPSATVPTHLPSLARMTHDPVFEDMTALSGGSVFLKAEGTVTEAGQGSLLIELGSVIDSLGVEISYLPGETLRITHLWEDAPSEGEECSFWLYADSVGESWSGYDFFVIEKGE